MDNPSTHCSRVYSHTIILVIHVGTRDNHIAAGADIEPIRIMTTQSISSLVVNSHVGDSQSIAAADANSHERSVLNVEVRDSRRGKTMGVEELRLRLAAGT